MSGPAGPGRDDAAESRFERRAREHFEIWNREGLDAFAARFWHPDLVWVEPPGFPDGGTHHGRDACVERMSERLGLLGHVQIELVSATAPVPGWSLIEVLVRGEGSSSGTPGEVRQWFLSELRDGLLVRWIEFLDRSAALDASRELAERKGV